MALGRLAAPHLERSANRCGSQGSKLNSHVFKQGTDSHDKSELPRELEPAEDRWRGSQWDRRSRLHDVHGPRELQQDPCQEYCKQYGAFRRLLLLLSLNCVLRLKLPDEFNRMFLPRFSFQLLFHLGPVLRGGIKNCFFYFPPQS